MVSDTPTNGHKRRRDQISGGLTITAIYLAYNSDRCAVVRIPSPQIQNQIGEPGKIRINTICKRQNKMLSEFAPYFFSAEVVLSHGGVFTSLPPVRQATSNFAKPNRDALMESICTLANPSPSRGRWKMESKCKQ